jgi:antitoxin component YwqK of YwqJK toxin-antitoxin module
VFYYDNGVVEAEGDAEEGYKDGVWLYYYPNGKLRSCGLYTLWKHGVWTYFYPDGLIRMITIYKDGKRIGLWRKWDEEGIQHFQVYEDEERRSGHGFNDIRGYDTDDEEY